MEHDGQSPRYADVVPASASRFEVDRRALLETLNKVAIAATDNYRAVRVVLSPRKIALSAGTPGVAATGSMRAKFLGGGDSEVHTAFNPTYLIDAVKSLDADRIIIDLNQNGCSSNGEVFGKPALLYSAENPTVRWLMMPVNAGLEPGPKSLGSNYRPPEQSETA
jgi:DNA polymerase III sliding clamp (beta) subunit (PCNA family)